MYFRILGAAAICMSVSGCLDGRFRPTFGDCANDSSDPQCADAESPTSAEPQPLAITLAPAAGVSAITNDSPILVTINLPAELAEFPPDGVVVTNGKVVGISGGGKTYTISVEPLADGEVKVALSPSLIKALGGSSTTTPTEEIVFTYDGSIPTLSFTSIDRTGLDLSTSVDPIVTFALSESAQVTLYKDNACSSAVSAPKDLVGASGQTVQLSSVGLASKITIYAQAKDAAGNLSACTIFASYSRAFKFIDPNPTAGNGFGSHVVQLASGNIVVTSPSATVGGISSAGAVYLYSGTTGSLISTLYGTSTNDRVGFDGVTALTNGHFVVASRHWAGGQGAVTWVNGVDGLNGAVSTSNSLYARFTNSFAGSGGVVALTNGNYVAGSPNWYCSTLDGCATDENFAGAVTWGNGAGGTVGMINATNSLHGSTGSDNVGSGGITALSNGNYVVRSPSWDSGAVNSAGAVTWGNGSTGATVGAISAANSLIGSTASDQIGSGGVTILNNGNYVISSPNWDCQLALACAGTVTNVGAATWVNGSTGLPVGAVADGNSLRGTTTNDQVSGGNGYIVALTNGNYVVVSPYWDCQTAAPISCPLANVSDVGAATWVNGTTGTTGQVTFGNSLVGGSTSDLVGIYVSLPTQKVVIALTNGNYVVSTPGWDCHTDFGCPGIQANVGAITWADGSTGLTGYITATNSLRGDSPSDYLASSGIIALSNGNYVVSSSYWNCPAAVCGGVVGDAGAVTWGNGSTGTTGLVSANQTFRGSTNSDDVGLSGVVALANGNYAFASPNWDCQIVNGCSGFVSNAGAATWGNGSTGSTGVVGVSNSFVGSTTNDQVGLGLNSILALTNGNYVVSSLYWNCQAVLGCSGAITDVGAITWGNGSTGSAGVIAASNSLVGGTANDMLGFYYDGVNDVSLLHALTDGNYVVRSNLWDCQVAAGCTGALSDAGAVTWGDGSTGATVGPVKADNSLVGSTANDQLGDSTTVVTSDDSLIFRSSLWGATNLGLVIMMPGNGGVAGSL